jgi:hypothetical protein
MQFIDVCALDSIAPGLGVARFAVRVADAA